MTLTLEILSPDGETKASRFGQEEVALVYDAPYAEGDQIALSAPPQSFLWIWLDDAMPPALVYHAGGTHHLPVPFGAKVSTYSPRAFTGRMHRLQARIARPDEISGRRDLAYNPYDHHGNDVLFPHASANVETRGEAVFAARNAIDGEVANDNHGFWPYTSWGINQDPNAALTLDFGRMVEVDEIALTIRADFPHDAWWEQITILFDGEDREVLKLIKTAERQSFPIARRKVQRLTLHELIKADDPSPFPALTRIEVLGAEMTAN